MHETYFISHIMGYKLRFMVFVIYLIIEGVALMFGFGFLPFALGLGLGTETLQSLPIIGLYYTITADCIYVNLKMK